jgi:DNA-binding GntR family transcriptional regulator
MAVSDRSPHRAGTGRAIVGRTVLREQVKEVLLERILAREYAPGDRLVETRIAQEFGISQAPVREALRELETLRFVESAPFKGAWVREVDDRALAEIYPIRAALEDVAARIAAERLAGKVAPLEREIRAMAKAKDLADQVEHDVRFHELIVEASGNARLIELWNSLQVEARTMITALRTRLDAVEVAKRHEPIAEALRRQDADAAGQEIRRHVEDFGRMFVEGRGAPEDAAAPAEPTTDVSPRSPRPRAPGPRSSRPT